MTWFNSRDIIPTDKQPIMVEIDDKIHIAYWCDDLGGYEVGTRSGCDLCGGYSHVYFRLKTPYVSCVSRWKPFFVKCELEDKDRIMTKPAPISNSYYE